MGALANLEYENISNRRIDHFSATAGVPFPEGRVMPEDRLALKKADGTVLGTQSRITSTYPDGSVRWAVLDFALPLEANERGVLAVEKRPSQAADSPLAVHEHGDAITVTNAWYSVSFPTSGFPLFSSFAVSGRELLGPGTDIVVKDGNGKAHYASFSRGVHTQVVNSGPEKVVVESSGHHTAEDDGEFLGFRCRFTIRSQDPCIQIAYKFTNRQEPERGVAVQSIRLLVHAGIGDRSRKWVRQTNHGAAWHPRPVEIRENVELVCARAFNETAREVYGSAADGKVVIRNLDSLAEDLAEYPYYLRPGNPRTDMSGGLRQVYPYIGMNGDGGSLLGWFAQMGLHFPKHLRAERNRMVFEIWPAEAGPLELRRGMSKEHDIFLSFSDRERTFREMEDIYFEHEVGGKGIMSCPVPPVRFAVDPEYARQCRVLDIDRWLPFDMDRYMDVEQKVSGAGAAHSGAGTGALIPVKGMLDVGDRMMRQCWHNNENDAILTLLRESLRTGSWPHFHAALLKAKHNAHVDFIAYDPDPLREGTMPAHPPGHTDGATYPSHMWCGGLLAAYEMTGCDDFLGAAISVGENMKRWKQLRPEIFYADSRECGWPMIAFVQLYLFTHDSCWLDDCEDIFQFYRSRMGESAEILYALPHGVGTFLQGYGEFTTWRACFAYWEVVQRQDIKDFLVRCLSVESVYKVTPERLARGGWGCNDLFPAWAAYKLTGETRFLEENYPALRLMLQSSQGFQWAGVDVHYFLNELHRHGELDAFMSRR